MEQESETPLLYDTLRRVGYGLRLAVHFLFILVAFGTVAGLFVALLIK